VATNWQINPNWLVRVNYSYLDVTAIPKADSTDNVTPFERNSPNHTASLHSTYEVTKTTRFDLWSYYVDRIEQASRVFLYDSQIDDFVSLNIRLGWDITPNVNVALLATNLFEHGRVEYIGEILSYPTEVESAYALELSWRY
jgi:iron complex outermembrane receptor protein